MAQILKSALPKDALLQTYSGKPGHYTDCYFAELPGDIDLETFVRCFYQGRLFGIERFILNIALNKPSDAKQLDNMLAGKSEKFAAWTVENRTHDQLLMCDYQKRTRSWFMVQATSTGTCLYFGSAVVPVDYLHKAEKVAPFVFHALMPFHKLYSRLLLSSAARRLQ